jgi:hypothetical protein
MKVSLSCDGTYCAIVDDGSLACYAITDGALLWHVVLPTDMRVVFSPCDPSLLLGVESSAGRTRVRYVYRTDAPLYTQWPCGTWRQADVWASTRPR